MKLFELFDSSFGETSMRTINDTLAQKRTDDTRKPKITLAKLNKLRKLRELRKFQDMKNQSLVSIMYGKEGMGPPE